MKKPLATFTKAVLATVVASTISAGAFAFTTGGSSSRTDKMILGDSIFALSGDIHSNLERNLGENIDTYAQSGCQMNGTSFICGERGRIPNQYKSANKNGINTVIFNGGGNDFLLGDGGDCRNQACIEEVLAAIEQTISGLVSDMKRDGISEIVYLGYYNTPSDPDNVAINGLSMAYKAANYPAMGVKFVDTRNSFAGNERSYIKSDGIHPTAAGSRVLADLIEAALD